MSATPVPRHPVLGAVEDVRARLMDVVDVNPTFMEPDVQRAALVGIAAARAQLEELELRLVASAARVAQTDAARDVAAWQVAHNRRDIRAARAEQRLAEALDRRFEVLRVGMAQGRVQLDQAHVIADALDALPADVDAATVADAEVVLVDLAARHTPRELRRLGQRVLHTVRPETADQTLARQVEAEEVEARGKTKLSFRPHGDGTTRISAVVPDATAARLKTYLDAFTSPRQGARRGEGPYPRILGAALCALLERLDPEALPRHGGRATTLIVTMSLAGLRQDLATGQVLGGESFAGGCSGGAVSAAEVRRLACTAGLVPAVLGGQGEVLDLGRERRLFSPAQVKALIVNQRTCRAEGCDMPAAWCEAHHWDPWSQGGRTDLNDGVMLCAHHHHRVHDPRYESQRNPGGTITITRRRT